MSDEVKTVAVVEKPQAMMQRDELSAKDVVAQIVKVQQIKGAVMKKDLHYGTIPGTPKPTLYKAGAEILAMTFRMSSAFEVQTVSLGGDHREYSVTCTLTHITSELVMGQGVGSCATTESKYRYRNADAADTGKPVPKKYWDLKNDGKISDAHDLIGGKGFGVKKIDGVWKIVKTSGEKVEHGNPADFYNTCLKMAKKRAYVDAVITATGGSGDWTQDLEDFSEQSEAAIDIEHLEVNGNGGVDEKTTTVQLITDKQWAELGNLIKAGNIPKQKAVDFFALHGWNNQRPLADDFDAAKKLVQDFVALASENANGSVANDSGDELSSSTINSKISDQQVSNIYELVDEGWKQAPFVAWMKGVHQIERVEDLLAEKYDKFVESLKKQIAGSGKKK